MMLSKAGRAAGDETWLVCAGKRRMQDGWDQPSPRYLVGDLAAKVAASISGSNIV